MKKNIQIWLCTFLCGLLCGCCLYIHRRVIAAWLKGEPMPKAPKWHLWVKRENRRS